MRVIFILLVLTTMCSGATIVVPTDFNSIQDAINFAMNGDTILVKPGLYMENLDYTGKTIVLKSEQGPSVTIIDGGQLGSVVRMQNFEGPGTVLEGFTLTNGIGTLYPGNTFRLGGGIFCEFEASPIIKNNIITNNTARYGGGICTEWSIELRDNVISGNTATYNGGGVYSTNAGDIKIIGNQITDNQATYGGGGMEFNFGSYGVIRNNILANNSSGGGGGGGIKLNQWSAFLLENNVLVGNQTNNRGGGVFVYFQSQALLVNNTLTQNSASGGGGLACVNQSSADLHNTILWENTANNNGPELFIGSQSSPSECSICCSDLFGGQNSAHVKPNNVLIWGQGMIDEEPFFESNSHWRLSEQSPCINRGSINLAPSDDIDGDMRPCMGSVDMGADEFSHEHRLEVSGFEIPLSGATLHFLLNAQSTNGGRNYLLAGGITGCTPGTALPGASSILPVNFDDFTYAILLPNLNTMIFQDFTGVLNADGTKNAYLNSPPRPFPSGCSGLNLHFAFFLGHPWEFVSNPVEVKLVD